MLVDEWNHHKDFLAQQEKRIVDTKDQFRAREQILMEREKADVTRTQNVAEVNGPSKSPAPREGQISNTNHMQGLRKGEGGGGGSRNRHANKDSNTCAHPHVSGLLIYS